MEKRASSGEGGRRRTSPSVEQKPPPGSNSTRLHSRKSALPGEDDPNRIWDDLPKHLRLKKRMAYIRRHSDLTVSSKYQQFKLLMWKNYIVTKRRWKTSLLQFFSPTFFATLLVISVSNNPSPGYDDRIYDYFGVDDVRPQVFNHCSTIYITPKNPATINFRAHLEKTFNKEFQYEFMKNGSESIPAPSNLCALIEFSEDMWKHNQSNDTFAKMITYQIRFPAVHDANRTRSSFIDIGERWDTEFLYPTHLVDGARESKTPYGGHPGYYENGFLYIQHKIALELMEIAMVQESKHLGQTAEEEYVENFWRLANKVKVRLRRFPFPAHDSEATVPAIGGALPTSLVVGYGISCIVMTFFTVREKEMGIRMLVKMYGINERYHKYAWIIHNLLFQSISAMFMCIITSTSWSNHRTSVALIEDEFLGLAFFLLIVPYIFNLICSMSLLVCFFSRTNTACISVCFVATVSYLPYIYVKSIFNILGFWGKFLACLPSNTALGVGCLLMAQIQSEGNVQISWSDIIRRDGEFCLGHVMIILIVMGIAQLLLANYLSRVFPDSGLQKLPWNFLCKSWFWRDQLPPDQVPLEKSQEKSFEENHPEYFEDDSSTKQRKELCIENISKYNGTHRALHKVNLLCYQGHVTVLLGNQGSGKSSLLKILNGTMMPSLGTVYLSRKDLYKNPVLGRAFVGYCPSDDLLFPDLTVDETLQFFTNLKGVSNRIEAYEEVERFLRITSLSDFRDSLVCELTKSSQRMLMVATAFCGGSRVVLLDDPTLNLSASQQRVLWDFTAQEKKHRTILVAMDLCHEVDTVVDKIVLLHYGQITAKGSLEFLKDKFGGGYHLELELKKQFNQEAVLEMVKRNVLGSRVFKARGRLMDFYLPQSQCPFFAGLLEELHNSMEFLGVEDFTVKYVTLEELHLRLKRKSSQLEETDPTFKFGVVGGGVGKGHPHSASVVSNLSLRRITSKKAVNNPNKVDVTKMEPDVDPSKFSCGHAFLEFKAMFLKNFKYSFRNKTLFLTATLAPLVLLTITCVVTINLELKVDLIPHVLNFTNYKSPKIITDMYRSTNEGVFMRASVRNLVGRQTGIVRTNVAHNENMITTILKDYNRAEDEHDVSLLAIEILPFKTPGCNHGKECVKVGLTGYFNNQPLHTPAVVLALVHNILLDHAEDYIKRTINETYEKKGYFLNVSNHPLTFQPSDYVKFSQILIGPGYVFGICTSLCYTLLLGSYIIMHVKEQGFRHMQLMCGASKPIYWLSNYLWNMIHFSVVAILHMLILALLGIPGYPSDGQDRLHILLTIFILVLVFGWTGVCTVGSYASGTYKSWGRGFAKMVLLKIISGPLIMMMLIPTQSDFNKGDRRKTFTALHNIFMLCPSYAFGTGLYSIVANEIHKRECGRYESFNPDKCDKSRSIHPFNEFDQSGLGIIGSCCYNRRNTYSFIAYGIGRNILCMLLVVVFCICQKIFFYSKKMRSLQKRMLDRKVKKWQPLIVNEHEIKDYFVLAEQAKIYNEEDARELTIKNLTLETPVYVKLDNICLEVKKGECFALLGALGSGKSTFLKTLCGYNYLPTYGDVEFRGLSLLNNYDKYIKSFSYCPDFNPFLNELTGDEVMHIMGILRGFSRQTLEDYSSMMSENLGMTMAMEHKIKTYSFVQVKKLCFAVSLMGKFDVLLLDNPTHHMDPKSRKFIMHNVKQLMEKGVVVVWASHGIEHCEGICSKMSILVNGHLKCIGSLHQLKQLYEGGFTIIVRFVLDKDMIYFTSKKNIQMENELREEEEIEETVESNAKQFERQQHLKEALSEEEFEEVLSELAPWEQDLCPFARFFEDKFPDSILVDKQPGFIHYHVHKDKTTWWDLFKRMEEAKVEADVDSYYITTTNLDQVFFNFTRGQITFDLERY